MKHLLSIVAVLLLLGSILWFLTYHKIESTAMLATTASSTEQGPAADTVAQYRCADDVSLTARFRSGAPATDTSGQIDTAGSVTLTAEAGVSMTLPQSISTDDGRYANPDDSFVFWSKGNTALILERGATSSSYRDCVVVAPDPNEERAVYYHQDPNLTLRYPAGWESGAVGLSSVSSSSTILASFTVAPALSEETNLGGDSGLWLLSMPAVDTCDPANFLLGVTRVGTTTIEGVQYRVASSSDAGVGNRYEFTAYAQPQQEQCIGVVSLVHYTVLENHPEETVTVFDEIALDADFKAILSSLRVAAY